MAYGFNDNLYKVVRAVSYYDVFDQESIRLTSGDVVGSAVVNAIIVKDDDRSEVDGLEGQDYIDKMVELGYVTLNS